MSTWRQNVVNLDSRFICRTIIYREIKRFINRYLKMERTLYLEPLQWLYPKNKQEALYIDKQFMTSWYICSFIFPGAKNFKKLLTFHFNVVDKKFPTFLYRSFNFFWNLLMCFCTQLRCYYFPFKRLHFYVWYSISFIRNNNDWENRHTSKVYSLCKISFNVPSIFDQNWLSLFSFPTTYTN